MLPCYQSKPIDPDDIPVKQFNYPPDYIVIQDTFTVSETAQEQFDFSLTSTLWKQNKTKHGKSLQYCCGVIKKNGRPCKAPCFIWKKEQKQKFKDYPARTWSKCSVHRHTDNATTF
jgi:hypothetical protein